MPTLSTTQQHKTFENFLIDQKHLTLKHLAQVHEQQAKTKVTFDDALLGLKFLDEEKLARAKADFFHLPYADLKNAVLSKDAVSLISKDTQENYKFIPFAKERNMLKVELYLTSKTSYEQALRKSRTISTEVGEALEVMKEKEKEKQPKADV